MERESNLEQQKRWIVTKQINDAYLANFECVCGGHIDDKVRVISRYVRIITLNM
jgi:hypothetical protein